MSSSLEKQDIEKHSDVEVESGSDGDLPDLYTLHEKQAGRLIIDPVEAKIELGERTASKLKLSRDGTKVLWPQPTDSDRDPQNWSDRKKALHLFIITLAAVVPDFDSGIGIASLFALAREYDTTTGVINNMTSNWSIFLLGWGGLFAVMIIRRYGRLPVLFWSQVLALGFLIGCTFAPDLATFTAMRCLTGFFGTAPQVTGLYVVTDLYPFHLQARKLNIWTMGFLVSPFLSPFAFGFLVARENWRWSYGIGSMYGAVVCLLIFLFMDETMYDRTHKPIPEPPISGSWFKHPKTRLETLIGITGYRMSVYRQSWTKSILDPLNVVWRPHILAILVFEAMLFGFSIGINVTNVVFLGEPEEEGGRGFGQLAIAGMYGTPIVCLLFPLSFFLHYVLSQVSVLLGEIIGRYVNDWITDVSVRRNKGVFEAESRLWTCYIALPLYITGFLVLGASFQNDLTVGAIIMGWGIAELAVMIGTVAVYAYCNDCVPRHQGEVSALINLARTLGGFSVAYFQVPWAVKHGALQTFGCEAAIVTGLFFLIVPALQIKGASLRARFSL